MVCIMTIYEVSYINQYGFKVITRHYSAEFADLRMTYLISIGKNPSVGIGSENIY